MLPSPCINFESAEEAVIAFKLMLCRDLPGRHCAILELTCTFPGHCGAFDEIFEVDCHEQLAGLLIPQAKLQTVKMTLFMSKW